MVKWYIHPTSQPSSLTVSLFLRPHIFLQKASKHQKDNMVLHLLEEYPNKIIHL